MHDRLRRGPGGTVEAPDEFVGLASLAVVMFLLYRVATGPARRTV